MKKKEWTLEEAKEDYKKRRKKHRSCKNCKFAHTYEYISCEVRDVLKKIHFPRLKAKFCRYYK